MKVLIFCLFLSTVSAQNGLSDKYRAIVRISSEVAEGDLSRAARAMHEGLNAGLTVNQIKEVLIHTHAYCGFPRSIRGLQTFMSVIEDRTNRGIVDSLGREAQVNTSGLSRYEQGRQVLSALTGVPPSQVLSGYAAFAPTIERFLKEHLFADLFMRDVLTFSERELVTIAVIASIGKAEPMLRSHLSIGLQLGMSEVQLHDFLVTLKSTISKKKFKKAKAVVIEVLEKRKNL